MAQEPWAHWGSTGASLLLVGVTLQDPIGASLPCQASRTSMGSWHKSQHYSPGHTSAAEEPVRINRGAALLENPSLEEKQWKTFQKSCCFKRVEFTQAEKQEDQTTRWAGART